MTANTFGRGPWTAAAIGADRTHPSLGRIGGGTTYFRPQPKDFVAKTCTIHRLYRSPTAASVFVAALAAASRR